MFKQLIDAFRKTDEMGLLCELFSEMLDDGLWMFSRACPVAAGEESPDDFREEFYAKDKQINQLERDIRTRIVIHLITGHDHDVGFSLVLMSVVKDAERIGDYCKNVYQIGEAFKGSYKKMEFRTSLDEIAAKITQLFPQVRNAFIEASKSGSTAAVEQSVVLRKQCDMLIGQLLTPGNDISGDEAAALAMRVRYFKRISAHLGNIATSVNNPVPLLDYNKNKPLDEPDN